MTFRITTVCTGNICRSPMAEYLIRRAAEEAGLEGLVVDSAGVSNEEEGNGIDPRARTVLEREGIGTEDHRARQFRASELAQTDLVLALDLPHYRALRSMAQNSSEEARVRLLREFDPAVADQEPEDLGIYDPWYGNDEDFETTFGMIRDAVPGVVEEASRHPEAKNS